MIRSEVLPMAKISLPNGKRSFVNKVKFALVGQVIAVMKNSHNFFTQ